jgi:diguanylate cyclase (GGDEF)-like protein
MELSAANRHDEARVVLTQRAIPAQSAVMNTLAQLEALSRSAAQQELQETGRAHEVARRWMILLSGLALLLGVLIASIVVRQTHRINAERVRMATHDPLTGLPNRMLLLDRLDQALLRSKRQRTLVGVLFIDLDGFKEVNDRLGHAAGDELLKQIAGRMKHEIRAGDIVARLGGDEFIVGVLDADNREQITLVSEKLLQAISRPCCIAGLGVTVSASVGVCAYPHNGLEAASLLKCADFAMYMAKQGGKNRVFHSKPEPAPFPS